MSNRYIIFSRIKVVDGKCLQCGKQLPSGRNRKYCSTFCRNQYFLRHTHQHLRDVLCLDRGPICQHCGIKDPRRFYTSEDGWIWKEPREHEQQVKFEAHHIVKVSDGGALFDLNNLLLLCVACHKKVHGKKVTKV